jgi:hypothetical protein
MAAIDTMRGIKVIIGDCGAVEKALFFCYKY